MSSIANEVKPLAQSILVPLGLTAIASATDKAIQKKIFVSCVTTLIISLDNIMKMAKSLEESSLSIKGAGETIKNETKEQKGRFLGMLLSVLAAS